MFGLRYHVASLAAVFVALAVGILLGVAVSGKLTDVGEDAERQNLEEDVEQLQQELESARAQADAATAMGEGADELFTRAYPTLMDRRLEGQNVAIVFLGPADGNVRAEVEDTLTDAGSGAPASVIALDVPVDGADLQALLEDDELLAAFADDGGDFSDLGRELGRELVEAEETPLWDTLATSLVEERSGTIANPMDSVVVVLNWTPPEEGDEDEESATEATGTLMDGLVSGLDGTGVPVVGAAASDEASDLIDFYRKRGLSSVDNVDAPEGHLALALLLAGAEPGHYGLRDTATDGVVPPIEPVTTEGE
ncbi:MAG: copper transporter [Gaiellaceae bacterium]